MGLPAHPLLFSQEVGCSLFTVLLLMFDCFISLTPSDPFSLLRTHTCIYKHTHTQSQTHNECSYSKHQLISDFYLLLCLTIIGLTVRRCSLTVQGELVGVCWLSQLSPIDQADLVTGFCLAAAPSPAPAMDLQTKINLPVLIRLVYSDVLVVIGGWGVYVCVWEGGMNHESHYSVCGQFIWD